MTTRREKLILLAVFIIACGVRVLYHMDELRLPPQHPDGYYYHRLAENVLRGRGYAILWPTGHEYRLFRPPGYPLFLAAVYSVAGFTPLAVRLAEIAISSFTVILLFFITARVFGKRAAWTATVLSAFYWPSILWSADYRAENLFVFFFMLSIYYLAAPGRRPAHLSVSLGAFFLALAYLVRPNSIILFPLCILWLFFYLKASPARRAITASLFIIVAAITISPWIYYNVHIRQLGFRNSMETTMGAMNVWTAHNPTFIDEVDNKGLEQINMLRYKNSRISESEWLELLRRESGSFLRSDPLARARTSVKRFKKHWLAAGVMDGEGTLYPDTGKNQYGILYFYRRFWKPEAYIRDNVMVSMDFKKRISFYGLRIPLLTFEGIFNICVIGFVAGLIAARGKIFILLADVWRRSSLLIILAAGYSLFSMVGFAHYRLRYPLEWIVLIFAGWGIGNILALLRRNPSSAHDEYPLPRCGYILAFLPLSLLFFSLSISFAARTQSRKIAAICNAPPQEEQALSDFSVRYPDLSKKLNRDISYHQAWQYQMEHGGEVDHYRGTVVCWTGEASFLRELPLDQLVNEPAAYRDAWKPAPADARSPLLIRLVIGSYAQPGGLGEGEVLIICDKHAASQIREGDPVTVLAEITGSDRFTMGYIIAFGHAFYRWSIPGDI
ncbi:MAG: glycosyltransferase family 39 protein [Candidatus Aureabacteria bacterium]|nr:glycosyltransferase family 39 protein [Candidatus Auribacterota bacterium]